MLLAPSIFINKAQPVPLTISHQTGYTILEIGMLYTPDVAFGLAVSICWHDDGENACNAEISAATVMLYVSSAFTVLLIEFSCANNIDPLETSAPMTVLLELSVEFRVVTPPRAAPTCWLRVVLLEENEVLNVFKLP